MGLDRDPLEDLFRPGGLESPGGRLKLCSVSRPALLDDSSRPMLPFVAAMIYGRSTESAERS